MRITLIAVQVLFGLCFAEALETVKIKRDKINEAIK